MISVVIPYFNREKTIYSCIESVVHQNVSEKIEIIIVDDCSNLRSHSILMTITSRFENVDVYRLSENHGANYARNFGVNKAKGDYIAFQDSDDTWKKNKLKKQLKCLKTKRVDIVGCGIKNDYSFRRSKIIYLEDLLPTNFMSTQTLLIKKSIFSFIKFDEKMPRFQDWEFLIRATEQFRVYFMSNKLVVQNLQNDSITKNVKKGYLAIEMLKKKHEKKFKNTISFQAAYFFNLAILSKQEGNYKKASLLYIKAIKEQPKIRMILSYLKFRLFTSLKN